VLKGSDMLAKHTGLYEKDNQQRNPYADMTDAMLDRQLVELQKRAGMTIQ